MSRFSDVVTTREQLRSVMNEPSSSVVRKVIPFLDKHCKVFISRSPFIMLATTDGEGNADVSPKGDPAGFVKIVDNTTLAIPDWLGNNRADSMENILQCPKVGLIFLVPGKTETLRVGGVAQIVRDQQLRESLAVKDRTPEFVVVVDVREAFFHCSKCMIRSKLWKQADWPDLTGLPRLAETMVDAGKLDRTEQEMHEIVLNDEKERLY